MRGIFCSRYEFYRSYHRGRLSAAPSRDIIGGECKQKPRAGRLSGGNQLRNCRSQAVLTGPCGGGQFIRLIAERKRFHRRRMMEPARRSGLHMSESDQVSAPEPARHRKWKATCVTRETGGEGRAVHPCGTRDIETSCRSGLYREYCVVTRVLVRCIPGENADERTRWDRRPLFATVIRAEFSRRYLAGDENTEKCNNATALKYEKECDSIVLIRYRKVAARNETSSE